MVVGRTGLPRADARPLVAMLAAVWFGIGMLALVCEEPRRGEEEPPPRAVPLERAAAEDGAAEREDRASTEPGPQSISVVGRDLTITRQGTTMRIDTPGTRIAMISNIRFEEAQLGETLEFDDPL